MRWCVYRSRPTPAYWTADQSPVCPRVLGGGGVSFSGAEPAEPRGPIRFVLPRSPGSFIPQHPQCAGSRLPAWRLPVALLDAPGLPSLTAFLFLFPNGDFVAPLDALGNRRFAALCCPQRLLSRHCAQLYPLAPPAHASSAARMARLTGIRAGLPLSAGSTLSDAADQMGRFRCQHRAIRISAAVLSPAGLAAAVFPAPAPGLVSLYFLLTRASTWCCC